MNFYVEVGGTGRKLEYSWVVKGGGIADGQGTSRISVQPERKPEVQIVEARVTIEGLPNGCAKTATETARVAMRSYDIVPDDAFGNLSREEQKGRLDVFLVELSIAAPNQIGLIVLSVTEKERFDSQNRRLRFLARHVRYRGFDMKRIWFSLEKAKFQRVTLRHIPAGGYMPCDHCQIIKASDLK
ncbi:MAG TPA: hypothetical protein VMZ26_03090 [Pyrinomonadaceae bacterium]|nr:hypothetical protein [Pyrinomonadaceae bacterium]